MSHPFRHFHTITKHRHRVIAHCFRAGIGWQGLFHDLSKYSPVEFWTSSRFYQGDRSPNDKERQVRGYSRSWLHHKGRNRHHYEYWTDYSNVTHKVEPVKMPLKYVIEMFCDRIAACRVYQKENYTDASAWNYYQHAKDLKHTDASLFMHEDTAALLGRWLELLKDRGEEEAFALIRQELQSSEY